MTQPQQGSNGVPTPGTLAQDIRREQPDPHLDRNAFTVRFRERFFDGTFDAEADALDRLAPLARDA